MQKSKLTGFIFILLFLTALSAHAAGTVLEVGLPGVPGAEPGKPVSGIVQYISFLYTFVLGFVGIAGFASLVFWGAVWAGSGVIDKKAQAIDGIKNSMTGIGIALVSFITLNTINPDLVMIKLPLIKEVGIKKETIPLVEEIASIMGLDGTATRQKLKTESKGKIDVNRLECRPDCERDCGCTSLSKLPLTAFNGLLSLADNVNSSIVITGGTENYIDSRTQKSVHKEHGPGLSVVDLRYTAGDELDNFIRSKGQKTSVGGRANVESAYSLRIGNKFYYFVREITPPHWHVKITSS